MSKESLRLPQLPLDSASIRYSDEITALPGVRSMVVLPDGFTKSKYVNAGYKVTVPSSSVIVSEPETLYPQFRSRGIGCGMAALTLPLQADQLDEQLTENLLRALTYGRLYYAAYHLRLPLFADFADLSYPDFISLVTGPDAKLSDLTKKLNESWFTYRTTRLRHCFGRYFGGNHFFELQSAQAGVPELNLQPGQAVAFYHTGCQGLEALLPSALRAAYIQQPSYIAAAKGDAIYDAFFTAQSVLLRYVNAYREATQSIVDSVLTDAGLPPSTLIVNQGHNDVAEEVVNGKSVLVYRHNAVPIRSGQWAVVSGMYNHDSYLVLGGTNTAVTHHTIDHGLGHILEQDKEQKPLFDNVVTLERFHHGLTNKRITKTVPLLESPQAAAYFDLMQERQVIQSVVPLRPIINMKYTR